MSDSKPTPALCENEFGECASNGVHIMGCPMQGQTYLPEHEAAGWTCTTCNRPIAPKSEWTLTGGTERRHETCEAEHEEALIKARVDAVLVTIKEGMMGDTAEDPLDRVYHNDENGREAPEDMTCSRDMNDWITEVNTLRDALMRENPNHELLKLSD